MLLNLLKVSRIRSFSAGAESGQQTGSVPNGGSGSCSSRGPRQACSVLAKRQDSLSVYEKLPGFAAAGASTSMITHNILMSVAWNVVPAMQYQGLAPTMITRNALICAYKK